MNDLPLLAKIYVGTVVLAGAALLVVYLPFATFADPVLFGVLLLLSSVCSVFKVSLPLSRSGSTMSVSYAVAFAALLQKLGFPSRLARRNGARRWFDNERPIMTFEPKKDRLHVLSMRVHDDARRLRAGCAAGIASIAAPLGMSRCRDWLRAGFVSGRDQRRCFSHGILRTWVTSGQDGAGHGDWTGFELELVTDE